MKVSRSLFAIVFVLAGCTKDSGPPLGSLPFSDDFERAELGPNWTKTGGQWFLRDGVVYTTGANNAPLFLNVDLPNDVVVEFDALSETDEVDTKLELMTDGRTHQSGYVFILGGWKNSLSVIARLDEHGQDRKVKRPTEALGKTWYRWRVEKKGGDLRWYMNGKLYMTYDDPAPVHGRGHNRLAFSNWQNEIRYDNLRVYAYDQAPPIQTSTTAAAVP